MHHRGVCVVSMSKRSRLQVPHRDVVTVDESVREVERSEEEDESKE